MADPLRISISHQLGKAEARNRLSEGFDKLVAQAAPVGIAQMQHRWDGDTLHFGANALGQRVSARVAVGDKSIDLEVDLPGILAKFADIVAGRLRRDGAKLLGPPKKP